MAEFYSAYLEKKEQADPDILKKLIEIYNEEIANRRNWDEQAKDAVRVKADDLPLAKFTVNENAKTQYFVDNWVFKAGKWLKSFIGGASISFDIESPQGNDGMGGLLLEYEINFAFHDKDMQEETTAAFDDKFWFGYGCVKAEFDTERIDSYWESGTPSLRRIDPRNMYFRCTDNNPKHPEMFFEVRSYDKKLFKQQNPEYADKITDSPVPANTANSNVNQQKKDEITVIICQYKKVVKTRKIQISDQEALAQGLPGTWFYTEEEVLQYGLENLPEGITASKPVVDKDDVWFECVFLPSANEYLEKPRILNSGTGYFLIAEDAVEGTRYPFGLVSRMKGILDASIVVMTLLTILTVRMNKPQTEIEEGAIKEFDDYLENWWKLDYVAVIDSKWRQAYGQNGTNPIKHVDAPIRADIPIALYGIINTAIKNYTGAVDSARGEQAYSGQSGALASQLQAAASIYTKDDENKYHILLKKVGSWLKDAMSQYRPFSHYIKGINPETNMPEQLEVNSTPDNTFLSTNFIVIPLVLTEPEIVKAQKKSNAIQMRGLKAMDLLSFLIQMDTPNPDRAYKAILKEEGLLDLKLTIDEYPEIMDLIPRMIQIIERMRASRPQIQNNSKATA